MKRTAIILKKDLSLGQVGNISAILMAQAARAVPQALADCTLTDLDGQPHATPQYSIVILKANGADQLANTAATIRASQPELVVFAFGSVGQTLNNEFELYREKISNMRTAATGLVGTAVSGDDAAVRLATKKFSLM
jgi:hypothetical protein